MSNRKKLYIVMRMGTPFAQLALLGLERWCFDHHMIWQGDASFVLLLLLNGVCFIKEPA